MSEPGGATTGPSDLAALLDPRSIAVVGATPDNRRAGGRPLPYLRRYGYRGAVYPVNPRYTEIEGLPCYPSLAAVPGRPDLVVVAVPAAAVPGVLRECVRVGASAAVIYTSGFAEIDEQGSRLQSELAQTIADSGILVCGPNCQGVANLFSGAAANFSTAFINAHVEPGPIGFATQSGLFGGIVAHECLDRGVGLGYLVSTGNEAGVQFTDVLGHLAGDARVGVLGGYVESVRSGSKLRSALLAARRADKPVVLCKVGRSAEGARAAVSHTGSLTGSHDAYLAACRQWGAVNVADTEELFDVLEIFARDTPRPRGRRLGVLTNSGGIGVLCTDLARELGLELAEFSDETRARIKAKIPAFGSPANPVDVTLQALTDAAGVGSHLRAVVEDPGTDLALFVFGVQLTNVEEVVAELVTTHRGSDKPVVVVWMAGDPAAYRPLREAGIPVYPTPLRALRALRALAEHSGWQPPEPPRPVPEESAVLAPGPSGGLLGEDAALELLGRAGVPVVERELASEPAEAGAAAARLGFPVVAKVASPDLPHKSEAGAVALGLGSVAEVEAVFGRITAAARGYAPNARLDGVLVQRQVQGGVELLAGLRRDPSFGVVVLVGLGGVVAEALGDTAMRVAPLSDTDALAMLGELRGASLLRGFRGAPPVDLDAVADVLVRLGQLGLALPQLAELDVNPLLATEHGAVAVDALAVLAAQPTEQVPT